MSIAIKPRRLLRRAIAVDAEAVLAQAVAGVRAIRDRYRARRATRRWTSLSDHLLRDLGLHRGTVEARRLNIAWIGARDAEY